MKAKKSRYWNFIAYPDSIPGDWIEVLKKTGLPVVISPLHDADINADESQKKPHWHVMIFWSGPTTQNYANDIAKLVNGTKACVTISNRGYYRYLTHKDNPEKAQYDEKDILHLNGFDPSDYIDYTKSELQKLRVAVLDFINDNDICEYSTLLESLKNFELQKELEVAMTQTILFNSYCRSRKNRCLGVMNK